MANFFECEFPRTISYKAQGGPGFNTTVNEGKSGFEQRNQNWATARGKWTVSLTTPSEEFISSPVEYIEQLNAFFLVVAGKARGFRLKDHKDYTNGIAPQTIGVGDGVTSTFQLIKTYSVGNGTYTRVIWKPVTSRVVDYQNNALADTVGISVGGVTQPFAPGYVGGSALGRYVVDQTSGLVSFNGYSQYALGACTMSGTTMTVAYTLTYGSAPILNQQIVISGYSTVVNNGTFIITAVGTGTFSVTNVYGNTTTTDTGTGVISASAMSITGCVNGGGGSTVWSYTSLTGQTPVVGMRVTTVGMTNGANDVTTYITAVGTGTFTTAAGATVTESGSSGHAYTDWVPVATSIIMATYQYHFPVRFDTDELSIQTEDSNIEGGQTIITWNSIVLRELRLQSALQG
jgi:uncharacterized protein (TIGR02217 family)